MFSLLLPILLSALPLSLAAPAPTTVTLTVSNFRAVEGAQSSVSFHLVDPRPAYALSIDCKIPSSANSIYNVDTPCQPRNFSSHFTLTRNELKITRGWRIDAQNYFIGYATQGTYWKEGEGGNVTTTAEGKVFSRTEDWIFTVDSGSG